jgi:hypothetical protein
MRRRKQERSERGSALLVSLMVVVGLSMLGLGFVAISETESAISVNERNYVQTLQIAEAGARVVAQWFNDPEWAIENQLMPANTNAIKQVRLNNAINASSSAKYYKFETASTLLCDTPYKDPEDRFFGANPESADVVITYDNAATFLNRFNELLFKDTNEGGRVVEIRIYGPPVVGGTTTPSGSMRFWNTDAGTRYGLATIAVTAEKTKNGAVTGQVQSRRTVRLVVAEFPLPGADGPLQSGEGTGTTGNFRVHWGKALSNREIAVKRLHTSLPWHNAWERIKFEEGYAPEHTAATSPKYLYELIGKTFEDPWFWVSARGTASAPAGSPAISGTDQLWTYTSPNNTENAQGDSGYSGHFQNQSQELYPTRKNTLFTRPVYDVWKQIALAGAGQQGVYYLQYDDATGKWYDLLGESRTFHGWVNTLNGGEEGFFFFDTTSGASPQNPDGTTNTGILAPGVALTSQVGNPFLMRGFFYMNLTSFGSQGIQAPGRYCNYPGEPFRDVGYQRVNPANGKLQCDDPTGATNNAVDCNASSAPPANNPFLDNETNDRWDYQDLNSNGKFDYAVARNTAAITPAGGDSSAMPANSTWFVAPYSEACGLAGLGTNCSEPHEPYINIIYPHPYALKHGNDPEPLTVSWQDPTTQQRLAKKKTSGGALVTCTSTSSEDDCTSNRYDERGPLVILGSSASDGPILEGVIYNEGNYNAAGQAIYYGALLFQGSVQGSGTPFVFYDDSLATGEWAEKFENLPRTIITTIETDQ